VLLPPALAIEAYHHQRDGAKCSPTTAACDRRVRELHRPRDYTVRAHRRAGGERVRVGAAAAQLDVGPLPRRPRNSSGVVGRYLTDSTGLSVGGHIPKMEHGVPHNEDERRRISTAVVARQRTSTSARTSSWAAASIRRPASVSWAASSVSTASAVRQVAQDDYRRFYGATVNFAGRGEMIPNEHNFCEIDLNVVDAMASRCWGSMRSSPSTR
jgi:hypothetical protein